jgi:hypothetical protein
MPLVLIKEDGTGKVDANSYANVADGDAYHEGHFYSAAWTSATLANKEKALVMATRLIDVHYQFNGWKKSSVQALQWPREAAIDPDRRDIRLSALANTVGPYFESDKVPKAVLDGTCEMAREILIGDRTDAPDGEGVSQLSVVGTVSITFDKHDRQPVISHVAQAMLAKLGTLIRPDGGSAKLVRT